MLKAQNKIYCIQLPKLLICSPYSVVKTDPNTDDCTMSVMQGLQCQVWENCGYLEN